MPGKHKNPTIAFRPDTWEKALIEQRAALSGMYKKDFITQSCIYAAITVDGQQENIQRIIDALHDMQIELKEVAGQMCSGSFSLSPENYLEMKEDYLAFVVTVIDIIDGAAYLFQKEPPYIKKRRKKEQQLEQIAQALGLSKKTRSNDNYKNSMEKQL